MRTIPYLLLSVLLCLGMADGLARPQATAWITTFDRSSEFERISIPFSRPVPFTQEIRRAQEIRLTKERFQTIDGFGLAITQASCYVLLQMTAQDRSALLKEMFSPTEGAGSSLVRVCIGGSDFSLSEYTWWDKPGKENLQVHESEYTWLFPILDEIYRINPDLQIIGSPWSCPKWMKMDLEGEGKPHDSWRSGRLNPACYGDYADLFVKWIQTMEGRGYHVLAVTPQNEPLHGGNSMSLYMPWEDQREFVKVLGKRLKDAHLKTKILVFDHNFNYDKKEGQSQYPLQIYADPEANACVAGSAWHNYGGDASELDRIHAAAPDKDIYFTEASIGTWNYRGKEAFARRFPADMLGIFFGTLSRYGKGVTLWNLVLDENGAPNRGEAGGCKTCYGGATVPSHDWAAAGIVRNSHWFDVLHCSQVVRPGAVRTGTTGPSIPDLEYLAFRNPDASTGLLIVNTGDSAHILPVRSGRKVVLTPVPARSVVSLLIPSARTAN